LKGQDTLSITPDSFVFLKSEYKRTFKLIILDKDKHEHEGYLYKLSERSITLSNINPRNIDSLHMPGLHLETIPAANIDFIEVRRRNALPLIVVPLVPAFVTGYLAYREATSQCDHEYCGLTKTIATAGVGLGTFAVVFLPAVVAYGSPQTYDQVLSSEAFRNVLTRLQADTQYKVYAES
jgi:hypothetical protein